MLVIAHAMRCSLCLEIFTFLHACTGMRTLFLHAMLYRQCELSNICYLVNSRVADISHAGRYQAHVGLVRDPHMCVICRSAPTCTGLYGCSNLYCECVCVCVCVFAHTACLCVRSMYIVFHRQGGTSESGRGEI